MSFESGFWTAAGVVAAIMAGVITAIVGLGVLGWFLARHERKEQERILQKMLAKEMKR